MILEFQKMNGLGNDFIMVDDMDGTVNLDADTVIKLCDRHFGIGADGVILVRSAKGQDNDAYMHYINSDGTLAEMCGNGIRCTAKFVVDNLLANSSNSNVLNIETLSGTKKIEYTDDGGQMTIATVDMGSPSLEAKSIPVDVSKASSSNFVSQDAVIRMPLDSPWGTFEFTCVSMGNPHAVTFIEDWDDLPDDAFTDLSNKSLDSLDVDSIGRFFESHSAFPEKANIEFVEVLEDGLRMRVYERGCAETLACGTGACAVNVASSLCDLKGRANDVRLPGGTLSIDWTNDGSVLMRGPASLAYSGKVEI